MAVKRILYIKANGKSPERVGITVKAFDSSHVFSPRELATSGHDLLFGNFLLDISTDEEILISFGRKKVDDVDDPTSIESVE